MFELRIIPARLRDHDARDGGFSERDLLYKVLFDMKKDMVELKKLVVEIIQSGGGQADYSSHQHTISQLYRDIDIPKNHGNGGADQHQLTIHKPQKDNNYRMMDEAEEVELVDVVRVSPIRVSRRLVIHERVEPVSQSAEDVHRTTS